MPWSDPVPVDNDLAIAGFESIGRSIRRSRIRSGWTQRQLQAVAGLDQAVISWLENGKQRGLSWRRFARLVGVLGGLDGEAAPAWSDRFGGVVDEGGNPEI